MAKDVAQGFGRFANREIKLGKGSFVKAKQKGFFSFFSRYL